MSTVNRDRNELRRLVESYGKEDVLNYINHLDEGIGSFVRKTVSSGKCEELAKQITSVSSSLINSICKTFGFTKGSNGLISYSSCSDPRRKESGKKLMQRAIEIQKKAEKAKNGEKVSLDEIKKEAEWIKDMLLKWQK